MVIVMIVASVRVNSDQNINNDQNSQNCIVEIDTGTKQVTVCIPRKKMLELEVELPLVTIDKRAIKEDFGEFHIKIQG